MINAEHFLLIGAILLFVAVMAGKVAYRFGAPALLLFLGVSLFPLSLSLPEAFSYTFLQDSRSMIRWGTTVLVMGSSGS